MDYAVRAMLELASADGRLSRDQVAEAQEIPARYLEEILGQLRQAGMLTALRGANGGFELARDPSEISVADVARAVDGPLTLVQGQRPEAVSHSGVSRHVQTLWVGLRASIREVMEAVTLDQLVSGSLPPELLDRVAIDDAWASR